MQPQRRKLSHEIPPWVPDASRYFITINCKQRGVNSLTTGSVTAKLLESVSVYEFLQKWYIHVMVIMPDHIHFISSFNRMHGIRPVITAWKGFHAKQSNIYWQPDFFEHRLRNDAEFTEKFHYVLNNPARKNLVTRWQDWPHKFVRGSP